MDTADKLGTLPGPFSWVVNLPLWQLIIFAFMATPCLVFLLHIAERPDHRPVWRPSEQFYAFFPGDVFLSAFFVWAVWTARHHLPATTDNWYQWKWQGVVVFHVVAFLVAFAFFVALTVMDKNVYTDGQMWSPSKVYHNFLYCWYGYLVASTGIPVLWSAELPWRWSKIALAAVLFGWVICLVLDNLGGIEYARRKAKTAHVEFDYSTGQGSYVR